MCLGPSQPFRTPVRNGMPFEKPGRPKVEKFAEQIAEGGDLCSQPCVSRVRETQGVHPDAGGAGESRTRDKRFRKPLSLVLGCSRDYCLSRLKSWSSRTFSKDQWTSLGVHCSKNVVVF